MLKLDYRRMLLHIAIYAVLFFALPLYLRSHPGTMSDLGALVMLLLMICPAAIFILSGELGFRAGFRPLAALLPMLLFALSVLTVFEGSVTGFVYSAVYGLISLTGNAAGALFRKRTRR
ncbi:hypothetical protein [Paenibacillus rhizophilus]|uniref:Uncharacterized protein n=1 Tax=Paenibacillus rhizophilus TaxID=1850366 RepID=A0A3N9P0U9_9BACL|nr:hypothetical protein [Paenibacillus rhizophilus]RQW09818.1 hypothetical protein EH198_17165 [Paenibacillus rhizophilus]